VTAAPEKPLFSPERWSEVRKLLDRIDPLPPAERAAELRRLEQGDADLAAALRSLLDPRHNTVAEPLLSAVDRLANDTARALPQQVGPFRPLRRIGAGGMGVVYLAEREGADFTQRVALKLLEGHISRTTRFAARERRALAALTHPNITAFVDAGNDGTHAWLAMEYVDGEPLLEHCRSRGLDLRARVGLFDQVCAAVAHAHAQLIVHRDLKPSNVLVTNDGAAKLLDFGIAQILDATDEHAPATRVFTPEYASPEQLRGDHATTSTDVYSLGLLLYELVTGKRLPTIERHADSDWTTGELARLATTQRASEDEDQTLVPAQAKIVARQLRGDLGRIIAHAVAFAPAHRYGSVVMLREDLARWLDYRPLTIARANWGYVVARFVRRHRVAVATAAIALLALLALSGVALWQAQRARAMAARADHARAFLADLFARADPFAIQHGGRNPVDLLRDGAERIEREFGDAPEMQAQLRSTIATVLDRTGEAAQARDLMLRSVEQLRGLDGARAPSVGAALAQLAAAREDSGDLAGAHDDFTEAYAILQGSGPAYAKARIDAVTGLAKLANLRGDYADAERMHQAVLRERQASEGPQSADIAMDLMNLAADALYAERYADAETLAQRARAMLADTVGAHHARNIYVGNVLGLAQSAAGHTADSLATLEAALALAREVLPAGAQMVGNVMSSLGHAQFVSGDYRAATATLTESRRINDATRNPRRAITAMLLGIAQMRQQLTAEALETLRDARATMAAQTPASDVIYSSWCQAAYAAALAANGDTAEGARLGREARAKLLASPRASSVRLGEIDDLLADIRERAGEKAEARTLREEALATFRRVYGETHPRTRAIAAQLK
jgi:serine/threonine-protein kinase